MAFRHYRWHCADARQYHSIQRPFAYANGAIIDQVVGTPSQAGICAARRQRRGAKWAGARA